ncbi:hypothetical protein [Polaromonas sp. LjRoot131]|uniref:hypothetical protein n=1 Tax=Polaromonas sp. LjRoot131 TaxID=3342262 RepID=UPI003ECDC81C
MKPVRLHLHRTFLKSKAESTSDNIEEFGEDFSSYFSREVTNWNDLMAKPLVVVLGEAGSGKTWEFEDQAKRLALEGKHAFFIPLTKVTSVASFLKALSSRQRAYREWVHSNETAHFFLDAVDESRLNGTTVLENALQVIMDQLRPRAARITILLSSRISDWQIAVVRDLVDTQVRSVMKAAKSRKEITLTNARSIATSAVNQDVQLEVFRLAPLSNQEAKRLAQEHGANPVDDFWRDVEDGDYQYMAGRPRDVEWLAKRWTRLRKLGEYTELIEDAVTQRLAERNEGYIDAGALLSHEMLRIGAERIAAAIVFCKKHYVCFPGEDPGDSDVEVVATLPEWDVKEQRRLLGVAIFDEATYGRVKFNHRSVREYLAAHWVNRRIKEGLPISDAVNLFGGNPFGESVLLNSTRATLCWLAAINVEVREFVIANFPEMLMFEGDPFAWTDAEISDALQGYVRRLEGGFRPDWWNDLSELRRVARRIPSSLLSNLLRAHPDSYRVTPKLLNLVYHGRKANCSNDVFAIYQLKGSQSRSRLYALHVLSAIATAPQRHAIKSDLLSLRLKGNEYVAAALEVIGIANLSRVELTSLFQTAEEESNYGGGPMARAVDSVLKVCTLMEAVRVLKSLLASLPVSRGRRLLTSDVAKKDGWKIHVLPECFARVVEQLDVKGENAPQVLFDAALYIEEIRHISHATEEAMSRIARATEVRPVYRRTLIETIARNGSVSTLRSRLFYRSSAQIRITSADIKDAVRLASTANDVVTRDIWFQIASELAFDERPKQRKAILDELLRIDGAEKQGRKTHISEEQRRIRRSTEQKTKWEFERLAREKAGAQQVASDQRRLIADISSLRDGTNFNALQFLVEKSANHSSRVSYTNVNPESIKGEFGKKVVEAFSQGLQKFWRLNDTPNVLEYESNSVPWIGLIGLASLNHAFACGLSIPALSDDDLEKACRFCVWELDEPPEWFAEASRNRPSIVIRALRPWVEHELQMRQDNTQMPRTLELVYQSPPETKIPFLRDALSLAAQDDITNHRQSKRIFDAALALNLLDDQAVGAWVQKMLRAPREVIAVGAKVTWLNVWMEHDVSSAWRWIKSHLKSSRIRKEEVALCVANALSSRSNESKLAINSLKSMQALMEIYKFLSPYATLPLEQSQRAGHIRRPVEQARNAIPALIARLPGPLANSALVELESIALNDDEEHWLHSSVVSQAVREIENLPNHSPAQLQTLGDAYCRDPLTGAELLQQVMARISHIAANIENGPFSDRCLFKPGTSEEDLQLWLAARLNDTPNRKFSSRFVVHREPVVDAKKRTDIEVSAKGFKVCIEIKPLNRQRYSAEQLRTTLKSQLIERYLKGGQNSRDGILVLFLLENRGWSLPKMRKRANFAELIGFLSSEALNLCGRHQEIDSLKVIGIDCRVPGMSKPKAFREVAIS